MRIYLAALVLLSACTTGEQATSLREGMSPEEVADILGRPDGVQRTGKYLGYQYTNHLISGWSWDRADYVAYSKMTNSCSGDLARFVREEAQISAHS